MRTYDSSKPIISLLLYSMTLNLLFPLSANSNSQNTVYCTSNLDSTGVCINETTDDAFECIIVPGQIIECKDEDSVKHECVLMTQITATQAQFSCSELIDSQNNDASDFNSNFVPNDFENAF